MAYNSTTERLITLKKLAGKAHTSNDKGLANEALPSGVTLSTETIFAEPIPKNPANSNLYDITGKVEFIRFPSIFINGSDTSDGRHGFELKLPSDYESNSSNPNAGTYPYINDQVINITSGALQLIPTSFSNNYEAKPFYGGSGTKNSGTQIPILDARDWNLDYFNGVLFQQDPPGTGDHAENPDFVEAFLYIGNYLNAGGVTNGHVEITGSLGVKGNSVFDGNVGISGSLHDKNGNELVAGSIERYVTELSSPVSSNTTITFSGLTYPTADTDGVIDLFFNGQLLMSGSGTQTVAGEKDYYLTGSNGVKLGFEADIDDVLILKHNSIVLSSAPSGGGGAVSSLSNGADNRIATFSSSDSLNGEANLTFDGTTFSCTGDVNLNNSNDVVLLIDSTGAVFNEDSHDNIDFRVESTGKPHAFYVDSSRDQVLILSGGDASSFDEGKANDVGFYVSGSVDSKNTNIKGTSVFGGDLVVSGNLRTKTHYFYKECNGSFATGTDQYLNMNAMGEYSTQDQANIRQTKFLCPSDGSVDRVVISPVRISDPGTADNKLSVMFYKNQFSQPGNLTPNFHATGSTSTAVTMHDDGSTVTGYRGIIDFSGRSLEVTGSNNFNAGDTLMVGIRSHGILAGNQHITVVFKFNEIIDYD